MAIKHVWQDILGTTLNFFRIGRTGPRLKDNAGNLEVRNAGDTADVNVTASQFNASSDVGLVINSDAAGSGADWKINIARPSTGMTADWTLTLPVDDGSAGQVLSTDGSGNTSWISAASTASALKFDSTTLSFGDGASVSLFTLPANAVIDEVQVIVDTEWDTAATLTIGVSGDTAKYMGASNNYLDEVAKYVTNPGIAPSASPESLIATYSAAGASAGSARIIVTYAEPS